jgi:phosphomannomutase
MQIKFGTDGWRGVIADDFTFENVRRVAQATADFWKSQKLPRAAIVGYDNRFLSETFARLTAEVFAANGFRALLPPSSVPTPAVTYAVRDRNLCGAVMITASHNPPHFNGFKLKAHYAGPADVDLCKGVERFLDKSPVRATGGKVEMYDPRPAHIAAIKKLVDLRRIRAAKLRIVTDPMHGCGGRVIEELVGGETIRADRDVFFGGGNPEPIQKNLLPLCRAVKRARADIGLAIDGDADRLGIVDDKGRYVSIQLVFALLLLHLLRNRGEKGGLVVKSANSTVLISRICRRYGLECAEVPVGFKFICEQMRTHDVLLGGEESGGMGFRCHIPERDGILANLMMLELLATTKKPLSQLAAELQHEFGHSAYDRLDMHYPLEKRDGLMASLQRKPPAKILGVPVAEVKTSDGAKFAMKDDSWLMFRTSGTEPIIRIYSEATSAARVRQLLEHGRRLALAF